jgi:hypothetical protein
MLSLLLCALAGAIARRIAGGVFPNTPGGTVVARAAAGRVGGISQQHGWALIGPLALWAAAHGMTWWPLVLAAAAVGPIYWLATLWQPTIPWLNFNRDGLPDPPAWAEVPVGVGMGLGLGVALGVS